MQKLTPEELRRRVHAEVHAEEPENRASRQDLRHREYFRDIAGKAGSPARYDRKRRDRKRPPWKRSPPAFAGHKVRKLWGRLKREARDAMIKRRRAERAKRRDPAWREHQIEKGLIPGLYPLHKRMASEWEEEERIMAEAREAMAGQKSQKTQQVDTVAELRPEENKLMPRNSLEEFLKKADAS